MRLDHVQLAIPRDSEALCRDFYCGLLGWREIEKPPKLAARGGLWLDIGDGQVHLGVEDDFRPARKAQCPPLTTIDLLQTERRCPPLGACCCRHTLRA